MTITAHSHAHQAEVPIRIAIDDETETVDICTRGGFERSGSDALPAEMPAEMAAERVRVPLIRVCWARSGDKGDTVNIGVIGRRPEYMRALRPQLSEARVAQWFAHAIDAERGGVTRYEMAESGSESECLNPQMSREPRARRVCITPHPEPQVRDAGDRRS